MNCKVIIEPITYYKSTSAYSKGQLILKGLFKLFSFPPKKRTKIFLYFCPSLYKWSNQENIRLIYDKQHQISLFVLLSFVSFTFQVFFEARAEIQKYFRWFFGSNENFKICFRDLLTFSCSLALVHLITSSHVWAKIQCTVHVALSNRPIFKPAEIGLAKLTGAKSLLS